MPQTFLNILQEFDLDKTDGLQDRLERMFPQDWTALADTFDSYYGSIQPPTIGYPKLTPLTFCFPCLPADSLSNISPHLLFADKVFLDDPLYDSVALLEESETRLGRDLIYKPHRMKILLDVTAYIRFYLKAKDLISEKRLVPFKQTNLQYDRSLLEAMVREVTTDSRMRKIFAFPHPVLNKAFQFAEALKFRLLQLNKYDDRLAEMLKVKHIRELGGRAASKGSLLVSFATLALSGGLYGLSTDFISDDFAYMYRRMLDVVERLNNFLPPPERLLIPAGISVNGLQVPILRNVPVERVLDTIAQDPDVFAYFRSTLNEKLAKISSPVGSPEREKEIVAIGESISQQVSEITLVYQNIETTLAEKLAVHTAVGVSSILVAGLTTIGQNLNAIAVAGGVLGGAGLLASMKEFAQDWLNYQEQLHKLRADENYFLWKIAKEKLR